MYAFSPADMFFLRRRLIKKKIEKNSLGIATISDEGIHNAERSDRNLGLSSEITERGYSASIVT